MGLKNLLLKEYLEELCDLSKSIKDEDFAKKFLERYGQNPKEKIEQEIKEILREDGIKI